jgi:hypothetical protein
MPGDCPTAFGGHPFSPRPKPAKAAFIRDFCGGATASWHGKPAIFLMFCGYQLDRD